MARILLRFIEVDGQWSIETSSPDDAAWTLASRPLRAGAQNAPLPPANEAASWTGTPHASLCDDDTGLEELRRDILLGDPATGDVERLGGYLFAVLLGDAWAAITARFPAGPLDLELRFTSDTAPLQAFPWEMLFLGGRPLVIAEAGRPVSITRVIDRQATKMVVGFPLRVLFVVGQFDEGLRSGAEYLGIIRGVAASLQEAGKDVSAMVSVRSIVNASREDVQTMCGAWPPHIVHIVAHGEIAGVVPKIHLISRQANTATIDAVDAPTLAGLMTGPEGKAPLPALVVVNASQPAQPGVHLSFAARLVEQGVSSAIGMAGEVASGVCRLFAHALYRALAAQRPLPAAVASAQRAAALLYGQYTTSTDWARPALFVATGPPIEFTLDASQKALAVAVARVRGLPAPFCDRYQALDAFSRFALRVDKGGEQVLAFEQSTLGQMKELPTGERLPYQIGKTLLLNEIEWHSLIDGLIPCFVRTDRGEETPNNLLIFAIRLAGLLDDCREKFGLGRRGVSEALALAASLLGELVPAFDPARRTPFNLARDRTVKKLQDRAGTGFDGVRADTVGDAMREDIRLLMQDVRAVCSHVRGVVVILDDVDRYKGFSELLLGLVRDGGLGDAAAPAPVVLTYSAGAGEGIDVRKTLTQAASEVRKRTVHKLLEPFADGAEAELAYSQFLRTRRLTAARGRDARENIEALLSVMHDEVAGVPSFMRSMLMAFLQPRKKGWLVESDDDVIFGKMGDE